jgi:succinoglycan biosynthesis transport protein ExoP
MSAMGGGMQPGTAAAGERQRLAAETPTEITAQASSSMRGARAEPQYGDLGAVARHLIATAPGGGVFRTIVTSASGRRDVAETAGALARAIAAAGRQVVLVDWDVARSGTGLQARPPVLGLTEILLGEALFEDVIRREPASSVHVIAAGEAFPGGAREVDAHHLNLVLDALDEAYEHIIVFGGHATSRILFEAIEGRFDAGVVVGDAEAGAARPNPSSAGTLLGFEVIDIDVLHYAPPTRGLLGRLVRRRRTAAQRGGARFTRPARPAAPST